MGKRAAGTRCLECGEPITVQRFRLHPECSSVRRNRRKRERRAAQPSEKKLFACKFCKKLTERLCKTQTTCRSPDCKRELQKIRDERRTDRGPTLSPDVSCAVCGGVVSRRSPTHRLCDKKSCHLERRSLLQRTRRKQLGYKHWNQCPVCEDLVKDARKTYHPDCWRQLRNDKKRVDRNKKRILAKKIKADRRRKPQGKRISRRMEEMMSVNIGA